jgi:transcriptional regulator with XRE-family HTH domain
MIIGERLREIRQQKKITQEVIRKRTGLLRSYISRVEHGHTVPNVETLEKFCHALEVPFYQLFYEGGELPQRPKPPAVFKSLKSAWGASGKDAKTWSIFRKLLGRMKEADRKLLLKVAELMARRA